MKIKTPFVWGLTAFTSLVFAGPKQPLSEVRWNYLIREKIKTPYTVKKGDTLAKICEEELGDASLWTKLWEVNQNSVQNPHLLEPGQKILFGQISPASTKDSSKERTPASNKPKLMEEDLSRVLNSGYAENHRLKFLFLENQEVLGVITGSYDEKNYFGPDSKIYIGPSAKDKIQVGHRYAVIREAKGSKDPRREAKKPLDRLVQIVGEVEIDSMGDEMALGFVTSGFDVLERGDKLIQIPTLSMKEPESIPPAELTAKVLLGDESQKSWFNAGNLVILDQGKLSGMKLGHLFKVFDDVDPVFKDHRLLEPRSKGDIKIVYVADNSSVGYILSNQSGIEIGDVVISKSFLPEPSKMRAVKRRPLNLE